MKLHLPRQENRQLKMLNKFLNLRFKVDNENARDSDGARSWKDETSGYEIIRYDEQIPNIANISRNIKHRYVVVAWVCLPSHSYWEPDDYDLVELEETNSFVKALFLTEMYERMQLWEKEMVYLDEKELDTDCELE